MSSGPTCSPEKHRQRSFASLDPFMKMIGRVSLSLLVLALVSHFLHGYAARSSQLQTGNGIPVNPKAVENLHRRNLIVGGSAVDISSYPWAVFIGARRG